MGAGVTGAGVDWDTSTCHKRESLVNKVKIDMIITITHQ